MYGKISVKQTPYKGTAKKFEAICNNKKYVCYLEPFNATCPLVVNEFEKDITNTRLGLEIRLACGSV